MFFVHETLNEYMLTVNWYNIPPTLNKVLAHGKDIAEATPMPVSWTSEEGSESNTKFNRLMDISDPVIVSHSKEKKKPQEYIPEYMAGLFKNMPKPKIVMKLHNMKLTLFHNSIFLYARMSLTQSTGCASESETDKIQKKNYNYNF